MDLLVIFLFMFILLMKAIPTWVFAVGFFILAMVCICFWKRTLLRNTCIALVILIATAFLLWQVLNRTGGGTALKAHFGTAIDAKSVAKYRHNLIGIEDHDHFWELKDVDANACDQVIEEYNFCKTDPDRLFSTRGSCDLPRWWPKSTEPYSIYASFSDLGCREIWIAKNGGSLYIYKFSE